MQIQAQLIFTQDEVTCAPLDPKLSEYRDRLAFGDPSLDFRIRLFGARVRMGAPTTCVALVLPADCVLRAEGNDGPNHDAGVRAFCGIPEDELRIITAGPPEAPYRIAVECSAFDEVIAFARTYGLDPVAVLIPDGDEKISVPIKDQDPAPTLTSDELMPRRCETSAIEIPPALQRELNKRKMLEQRQNLRANKRWSLGKLIQSGGDETGNTKAPADQDLATPDAPPHSPSEIAEQPQPAITDMAAHDAPGQAIAETTETALHDRATISDDRDAARAAVALNATPPIAEQPPIAAPAATVQAVEDPTEPSLCHNPRQPEADANPECQAERADVQPPHGDNQDEAARTPAPSSTSRPAFGTQFLARPMLAMGLAACTGIIGLGFVFQLRDDQTALRDTGPVAVAETQSLVTMATETAVPATTPRSEPAPQIMAAASPADRPMADPSDHPGVASALAMLSGSNSTVDLSAVDLSAIGTEQADHAARVAAPRVAMQLPDRVVLPSDPVRGAGIAGLNQGGRDVDEAPTRSPAAFPPEPSINQLEPPVIADSASGGVRLVAARSLDLDQDMPVRQTPTVSNRLPRSSANGVPPEPRPTTIRAPDQTGLVTRARSITAVPTASLLGPERTPRPLARPASFPTQARTAPTPELVAALATVPVPETQAVAPTLISQGSVPGLRVLAIIGSDQQRQALVQTGPNQTAVLVAGSATTRWQVVEVRRDGVVLSINGQQRLLPIGL